MDATVAEEPLGMLAPDSQVIGIAYSCLAPVREQPPPRVHASISFSSHMQTSPPARVPSPIRTPPQMPTAPPRLLISHCSSLSRSPQAHACPPMRVPPCVPPNASHCPHKPTHAELTRGKPPPKPAANSHTLHHVLTGGTTIHGPAAHPPREGADRAPGARLHCA